MKIVLLLIAKPKITVDYVAEYNRISCPQDYDSNENAAEDYQKAYDAFVEMPQELRIPFINWPTDYNSVHQGKLNEWLAFKGSPLLRYNSFLQRLWYQAGRAKTFNYAISDAATYEAGNCIPFVNFSCVGNVDIFFGD